MAGREFSQAALVVDGAGGGGAGVYVFQCGVRVCAVGKSRGGWGDVYGAGGQLCMSPSSSFFVTVGGTGSASVWNDVVTAIRVEFQIFLVILQIVGSVVASHSIEPMTTSIRWVIGRDFF